MLLASGTAVISGVSIFVNSHGLEAFPDAAVYTTAKNLVAAGLLLLAALLLGSRWRPAAAGRPAVAAARRWSPWTAVGLAYVGGVGGGAAFVMFFSGLARSAPEPAAFLHDTLVVWVALLAWPALRERASAWNLLAIALLVLGQVAISGGLGSLTPGLGLGLILGATLLWSVEAIVIKRLLAKVPPATVAVARMGVGGLVLLAYLMATGGIGQLLGLGPGQWSWALLTGLLLAGYVGTWVAALARARALDVTSVLVGSALITAILSAVAGGGDLAAEGTGLVAVAGGTAVVLLRWPRGREAGA